jgi:16S rRNA (cytosine967-C5)-methyltransferase
VYYTSYLDTTKQLLSAYKPKVPLHLYLKEYFKRNKKHGSRDRKLISELCYNYFRLGFAFKNIAVQERILIGYFLSNHSNSEFLNFLRPEWNEIISTSYEEKLAILNGNNQTNIFPFKDDLSNDIDFEKFSISFLKQPELFIRIRPGYSEIVHTKLKEANMQYEVITQTCIALPNSSKIDKVVELDKEAVVQDYNSQRVGEFMKLVSNQPSESGNRKSAISVWDCCAASGGKSIMAYDINPAIQLTVSDKRESILKNLKQRFAKAGIERYRSAVIDLSTGKDQQGNQKYDLIIADVPCSGSGTWSRTPEQLYYFNQKQIKKYSDLQKQIIKNAIPYLKPQGWLLYITCSVFKKENEEVIAFIKDNFKMDIVKMELLKGYEIEADTMFAALLRAN